MAEKNRLNFGGDRDSFVDCGLWIIFQDSSALRDRAFGHTAIDAAACRMCLRFAAY